MAVTYNWGYKPGVANKYGITIAASADDVAPSNAFYVALWGNDTTGNGSRLKPFKTIVKCFTLGISSKFIIIGNGVYRETIGTWGATNAVLVGDGNVLIDGYTLSAIYSAGGAASINMRNISISYFVLQSTGSSFIDCKISNCAFSIGTGGNTMNSCLLSNCSIVTAIAASLTTNNKPINCTFYRCYIPVANSVVNNFQANLFYQCNVDLITALSYQQLLDFCLFYQCNFRVVYNSSAPSASTTYYPSVPSGYTYISTISALRTFLLATLINQSEVLPKSLVADPKFNNLSIEDFTLAFDSPARNLSYFGTYVGAYSISKSLAVKATDSLSAFDNASAVNLTIVDNSLTLIDVDNIASIVTKPIDNSAGRELQKLLTLGVNADRNGEYVDSTSDLDSATISAGTTLTASTPYRVEIGSITYDGNVYTAGQRFTSKATSVGTFTTSTSGVVREVLEAPARENVEARFSDGAGSTVDNTATLEELAWYFVEGATATYNGDTYAVGTFIKVLTGITSFTGSGLLRKAFSDTDPYFYFEINQKPTTNNTGNVRTGAIVRGNGDKDFDRTAANVFPINKKFIQLRYTIQVNNLTP